jgi:hypothetical protein
MKKSGGTKNQSSAFKPDWREKSQVIFLRQFGFSR